MMPWESPVPKVDERYKRFVRRHRCAACTESPPSDPHHLESGPMGAKASDWTLVPLCRECHDIYHQKGQKHLEEMYDDVNLWRQAHKIFRRYVAIHYLEA